MTYWYICTNPLQCEFYEVNNTLNQYHSMPFPRVKVISMSAKSKSPAACRCSLADGVSRDMAHLGFHKQCDYL